jgi:hypothetical protein
MSPRADKILGGGWYWRLVHQCLRSLGELIDKNPVHRISRADGRLAGVGTPPPEVFVVGLPNGSGGGVPTLVVLHNFSFVLAK